MRARRWLHSGFWPLVGVLLAIAEWARCAGFRRVFTPDGVLLEPTDSHYYVRFAQLQLQSFPRFTRFDPWLNFPTGANVLWPPLHAEWVAAHLALHPSTPEAMAAWVGPTTTLLWLPLIAALLVRECGRRVAALALVPLALLPVMIHGAALGNADHHVHEPFLALALALLSVRLLRRARVRDGVLLGAGLALSRLLTTLTIAFLPCLVLALAAGLWTRAASRRELARPLVAAGLTAAGLLELSALLFGDPGSLFYATLTSFLPLACLAGFGLLAGLAWAAGQRWRAAAGAFALSGLVGALLAASVLRAARDLAGGDPLIQVVMEAQPLWRVPSGYLGTLGAWGLLAPLAAVGLWRSLRSSRDEARVVVATWTLGLAVAFAFQLRFVQPLCGPLALFTAFGLETLWELATPRIRRAGAGLGAVAVCSLLPALAPKAADAVPTDEALVRSTLRWVREHTPSPPDYAVLATHDLGHLITLWAGRPNVSSPFSQVPWHVAGNARASAVLAATDDELAYQKAVETRARYLVSVPFAVILGRDVSRDDATMARRLLEHAALDEPGRPATAHFRLLHDSKEERLRKEGGPYARVFEIVKGASLEGAAPPGTRVTAELTLRTNLGRDLHYVREATADSDGRFRLRVAYPTDGSGEVHALGPYTVRIGDRLARVELDEAAVRLGRAVALAAPVPLARP